MSTETLRAARTGPWRESELAVMDEVMDQFTFDTGILLLAKVLRRTPEDV